MNRRKIEVIISIVGVITLSITPPIITNSEVVISDSQQVKIEGITRNYNDIEIDRFKAIRFIEEEAQRIAEEREEAIRIAEEEAQRKKEEELRAFEEAMIKEEYRKNNVSVNLDNVTLLSNITTEELIAVFDFYDYSKEMIELAYIFVEAEQTYGINAFILASIASWESSYNTSYRAIYDNNVLGWGVYSPSAEGINASSKYENIMNAAEFLSSEYLTEGGLYYNGLTTWGISRNYCRDEYGNPSESWLEGVNSIAKTYEWVYRYIFINS